MQPRTAHDLRCLCPHHTKLGEYGVSCEGEPYLHIRVFKQARVFGEVVATSGAVSILCRDCGRWMQVNIVDKAKAAMMRMEPHVIRRDVETPLQ